MGKINVDLGEIGTPPAGSEPTPAAIPAPASAPAESIDLSRVPIADFDKSMAERSVESAADPDPDPAADPEQKTDDPAAASDADEFESHEAYLKSQGIEGFPSAKAFAEAQQADFNALIQTMTAAGLDPTKMPTSMKELNELLLAELAEREMNPPAPQEQREDPKPAESAKPLDLSGFFTKHNIEAAHHPFYNDLVGSIAEQVKAGLPKQEGSKINPETDPGHLSFEIMLYDKAVAEAKAANADAPIPSFAESRGLVRGMKGALDTFRFFAGRLGNTSRNPYATAFQVFAASKAPGGVTKAQEAKTQAGAKKVSIAKSLLSPSPASRPKTKEFSELSRSEQNAALSKMEI